MPILQQKPVTPSGRFYFKNKVEVSKKRPEKSLTKGHHRKKGRNTYGRITSRRRGGGHKRLYRTIDFRRNRFDELAKVIAIEYDPNRTAHIALLEYSDGEKTYIQWFNSPGHYKIMFNPKFKTIGVGYVKTEGSSYTHYWTADFGY